MMTKDEWLAEARRYAKHIYCYENLIDDHIEVATEIAGTNADVYAFVETLGEHYDLDRADQNWGIHDGVPFEKRLGANV